MKAALKLAWRIGIKICVIALPMLVLVKMYELDIFLIAVIIGYMEMNNNNSRNNNNNNRGNGRGILYVARKDKPRTSIRLCS